MPAVKSPVVSFVSPFGRVLLAPALIGLLLSSSLACSSGSDSGGGGKTTGGTGGAGGRGGSGSSGSGGSGGSGTTGGSGGSGGSTTGGSGGSATGGSGGSATGGSGGSGGSVTGGSGGGAGGSGGSGGAGGTGGAGGMGGGAGSGMEAGSTADGNGGAGRPARVLIYTKRSTPTHDASIPVAVKSLSDLFKTVSIEVEASEAMTMFTAANLARFGAVVMVNSNGTPFGASGTAEGAALVEFVRKGGGLAAFHAAANTSYPASHPLLGLLGATFDNTGGGVRNVTCAPEGQHQTVAKVPASFMSRMDETYIFTNHNPMNQVVVRCDPAMGTEKVPASWVREEGAGRVFYTTLGHGPMAWEATSTFLTTHAWSGILWVLARPN